MTDTAISADIERAVLEACQRAKVASRALATATRTVKDAALEAMADALVAQSARIIEANGQDLQRGRANDMSPGLLDRLALTEERIAAIADALRYLAALPDPVGEVKRGSTLPNGMRLLQKAVPMGVVGMIYEARPNVTVDAAGLALKSGNAAVLRGGSAAARLERGHCCRAAGGARGRGPAARRRAVHRRVWPRRCACLDERPWARRRAGAARWPRPHPDGRA
ncbi:hypothetical protein GCM10025876_05680 [Demequina litorisediminis]|uniref:Gamma-glutamyl phosphate reductase n=1 Tax=Demequina litorisediminis TaxID=1849022 RepID=A0ABQ6IC89_9MICO|nr:hypothetical protein GCM10025876_05680 [Demequina litorisediminis]